MDNLAYGLDRNQEEITELESVAKPSVMVVLRCLTDAERLAT